MPHSESDSEGDQVQHHSNTKATMDHTSRSTCVKLTPYDTCPSIDTPTLSDIAESATPMVMNDFLQYFDFDLEFTDAMDTSMYNDDINRTRKKSCETSQSDKPH